ncbi:MAG: hypothetical protein ACRDMZ_10445 [Solirubrobacteraceae bacterium]
MPGSELGSRTGDARSGPSREPASVELHERLLEVCVLLLLQEWPASCADLRAGLRPLGFEQTATFLDETIAALAADGLVSAAAEPADGGAGTLYVLTTDGRGWLRSATADLRRTEAVVGGFLARCGERFVAA